MLFLTLCLAAEPERAPVPWVAESAEYAVTRLSEAEAEVRMVYRFRALEGRWDEQRLADPELRVLQVTGPATQGPGGLFVVLDPARPTHTVEMVGRAPLERGTLDLAVLPAARQTVRVEAPGYAAEVEGAFDGSLTHRSRLTVRLGPSSARPPREERPLVLAELGAAGWVEDGSLRTRARLRWNVVRGEMTRFQARVGGLGELEVEGANLARWERQGDVLMLIPKAPVRGRFEVTVSGRMPAPTVPTRLPAPEPLDVLRTDAWWTVGRADEGELIPTPGRRGVALRRVPEWARGLSDTPAVAVWEGATPVEVRFARSEPLPAPDAVVERASFVVVTNADGRTLIRGTWAVRNDRRPFLRLTPPPGFRVLTARVSSAASGVWAGPEGTVLIPLPRSVETVKGLVAVPVEVVLVGETDPWRARGDRRLLAPAVDAPVQEVRWEVHLPRGFRAKGDASAALPVYDPRQEAAQAMLDRAIAAYQKNDFAGARQTLEAIEAAGLANEETARLGSNLGVLLDSRDASDAAARRVRELANARTYDLQVAQAEAEAEAEAALRAGDVATALERTLEARALAERIAPTEQEESGEQADRLARYEAQVEALLARSGAPGGSASAQKKAAPAAAPPPPAPSSADGRVGFRDAPDAPEVRVESEPRSAEPDLSDLEAAESRVDDEPTEGEATARFNVEERRRVTVAAAQRELSDRPRGPGKAAAGARAPGDADLPEGEEAPPSGPPAPAQRVDPPRPAYRVATPAPPPVRLGATDSCSRARQLGLPPPPECEGAADVFKVLASAFTVALPLDGPTVGATQALVAADAPPTLTVRYRPDPGDRP